MKLQVILEPGDEGGYTVVVPVLPGCVSEGDTKQKALQNIREAIELYLEPVSKMTGHSVPMQDDPDKNVNFPVHKSG